MLIFVLEMLMEDFVESSSVEGIEKLSKLLCLCRESMAIRRVRTDESDSE